MNKLIIVVIVIILLTTCRYAEPNVQESGIDLVEADMEKAESTTVPSETSALQEVATVEAIEDVTEPNTSEVKEVLPKVKHQEDIAKIIEDVTTIDEMMAFYFEFGREGHYNDEISKGFYNLYKDMDFKEFVRACSRYAHKIQNHISSYLIYGLIVYENTLEPLNRDIDALDSNKVYSYFTERLIADGDLDNSECLNLEDDEMDYPTYQQIETGILDAKTIDELVELSFIYPIDGAYAEDYSFVVKSIYDTIGLTKFVNDCCEYGEVIQSDFAMHLAYGIGYYEEEVIILEEEVKHMHRDNNNEYFLTELEKRLGAR